MPDIIKWRVGRIDEEWKRRVAFDNRSMALATINGLNTILFGGPAGKAWNDFEDQCSNLRGLTGDQIAEALLAYWKVTQAELAQGRPEAEEVQS